MSFPDNLAQLNSGTAYVGPNPPPAAGTREGDLWADTSVSPFVLRVYIDGQWQAPASSAAGG